MHTCPERITHQEGDLRQPHGEIPYPERDTVSGQEVGPQGGVDTTYLQHVDRMITESEIILSTDRRSGFSTERSKACTLLPLLRVSRSERRRPLSDTPATPRPQTALA
ncbi:hypothetical protein DPEC_G00288360 [Dallia pectoralis]|uniref:Uncharacterized protein n=1 Tax=Dallia pectoralis TaxID=75939 RepID=A0ACC2FKK7_DALPE|nr:hypothetical protein DPEC_G00288360 [Dallia pectoralis]